MFPHYQEYVIKYQVFLAIMKSCIFSTNEGPLPIEHIYSNLIKHNDENAVTMDIVIPEIFVCIYLVCENLLIIIRECFMP